MSKNEKVLFEQKSEVCSSTCCVCRCNISGSSIVVSSEDRNFVFLTRNIWIPEGARCCPEHIDQRRLITKALDAVKPRSVRHQEWNSSDVETLLGCFRNLYNAKRRFNFDDGHELSDNEYPTLTGLSKVFFDDLVGIVSSSSIMRNSSQRSIRTAVGIYLCKLRLGLSNSLLSMMFNLSDKRTVARIINSARQALSECFTPYNLGFNHITRREVIDNQTTPIARQLMTDGAEDTAILVIDGTYIYIQVRNYSCVLLRILLCFSFQKSQNNVFQRKSFNLHKKRSLLKPMMIVSTTGYIVACIGPFFSDFSNNDASIIKNVLLNNMDSILSWVKEVNNLFPYL